jgi:hypothetical protein
MLWLGLHLLLVCVRHCVGLRFRAMMWSLDHAGLAGWQDVILVQIWYPIQATNGYTDRSQWAWRHFPEPRHCGDLCSPPSRWHIADALVTGSKTWSRGELFFLPSGPWRRRVPSGSDVIDARYVEEPVCHEVSISQSRWVSRFGTGWACWKDKQGGRQVGD